VIVGAGATAVSVFTRVCEIEGISGIRLVDPRPAGLGVAFGTAEPALLCNTSADVTSLEPDGASDLVAYLTARGWPVAPGDFVPRFLVGQYCRERYRRARRRALDAGTSVSQVHARVVAVHPAQTAGYWVELDDGTRLEADDVLLCHGLEAPKVPGPVRPHVGHPRLLLSPYPARRLARLPESARVLVLGSKLSAVDAALMLCRDGRTVTMASPSGRLPAVRTRLVRRPGPPARPAAHAHGETVLGGFGELTRRQAPAPHDTGLAVLDHECVLAESGRALWQDEVAEVIDRVNEVTASWEPADRAALLRDHAETISRFISAIPLRNARILARHMAKELLTVTDMPVSVTAPAGPGGWKVRWGDGRELHFDHVVCATGFARPSLTVTSGPVLRLGDDGRHQASPVVPEITDRLRVRLAPDRPEERIWALGASSHPRTAIVNYLRTAAVQAKNVADQLATPTER
jgi:uncharacterized NAD(P)/FAD-binding protein YdhS